MTCKYVYLQIAVLYAIKINTSSGGCSLFVSVSVFLFLSLTFRVFCVLVLRRNPNEKKNGNKFAVISAICIPKINFSKVYYIFTFCSLTQVAKAQKKK